MHANKFNLLYMVSSKQPTTRNETPCPITTKSLPIDFSTPGEAGLYIRVIGISKGAVVVKQDCQDDFDFVAEMGLGVSHCRIRRTCMVATKPLLRIVAYAFEDRNEHYLASMIWNLIEE